MTSQYEIHEICAWEAGYRQPHMTPRAALSCMDGHINWGYADMNLT